MPAAKGSVTRYLCNRGMDPAPPPSPALVTLRAFADDVSRLLGMARGLVDAGRMVDLTGLEDQVGLLCAKTLDLPQEDGRAMLGDLVALRAQLDGLEAAMAQARAGA